MAMSNMSRARFGRKLAVALYLIDDYTGRAAEQPVTVQVDQHRQAFRKGDGYYLIMEPELLGKTYQVEITSTVYQKQIISVDSKTLDRCLPVVKLRLYPLPSYPLAYGARCLQGTAPPNTDLYFINRAKGETIKLLYDYAPEKSDCSIFLFQNGRRELESGIFYFSQPETGGECAKIADCVERDSYEYRLAAPLASEYSKVRCTVFPIVTVHTDETGNYFYPLRSGLEPGDLSPLEKESN